MTRNTMAENKSLPQEPDTEKPSPTGSASPLHKRNSSNETVGQDCYSKNKRPKVVVDPPSSTSASSSTTATNSDRETKTVTPTSIATTTREDSRAAGSSKPASTSEAEATTSEVLDLAETLGLRAGTEIEVQWEIHNDGSKQDGSSPETASSTTATATNAAATNATGTTTNATPSDDPSVSLHWWKAKLLEHDGRTTDSVAIRTLLYEPRPDLGFPEESREDVVFLGRDVLVTSTNSNAEHWDSDPDSVNQMPYRRLDHGSFSSDEVFFYNEDQLEEQLDSLLMGAFRKNQDAWNAMPAAQQAIIAETINKKKKQLASILREEAKQNNNKVITPEAIKEILARTF